jgi:hypothetical protein
MPGGLEELKRELSSIPKSASALGFLAMVVKEFGGLYVLYDH